MLPLNTVTVTWAITPAVVSTWFSHYLNRKPLKEKPTAHISYDLGLHLVRRFVEYSAWHTIEELQAFTSQWVPVPHWVKSEEIEIPKYKTASAAKILQVQLGPEGIEQVGGKQWWQWRRDDGPLKAEWIEMRKDYNERKAENDRGRRVMLYVHGGAYYFGSVDEHRYQIMRHARKLKARCLAPRYRLAPQFPFPCGLHDCLSAYLYLLSEYEPTSIVVAGDSAGGGMVLSLLVILRDQGIPLPAGGMLLSPWVDLMHSFPSLEGDGALDYIPNNGFIHKPSTSWPPPTLEVVEEGTMPSGVAAAAPKPDTAHENNLAGSEERVDATEQEDAERGFSVAPVSKKVDQTEKSKQKYLDNMTGCIEVSGHVPSVLIDGNLVQIRDQIQMYAPNHLLTHPLVSPALQPSLGGLCPLLIQVGGGEMLRDEQIYIAHKAANPAKYPPSKESLDKYDPNRSELSKWKATDVQLQVWEDLCHVGHTLSWTRPAKFMYRSVAQFGAWALARAQKRPIDIDYDSSDTESESENTSDESEDNFDDLPKLRERQYESENTLPLPNIAPLSASTGIGIAGDPLPAFKNHMIRQRVDRYGRIYPLASIAELPALQLSPDEIGVLKEVPVRKWLARQEKWNKKFASTKRSLQKKRKAQLKKGYVGIPEGEKPPPTALAGRRTKDMPRLAKIKKSWGMSLWSEWGSKHDYMRIEREKVAEDSSVDEAAKEGIREQSSSSAAAPITISRSRANTAHKGSRSGTQSNRSPSIRRHSRRPSIRNVIDEGQARDGNTDSRPSSASYTNDGDDASIRHSRIATNAMATDNDRDNENGKPIETIIPSTSTSTTRPTHNGIAYPFRLKVPEGGHTRNSSLMTLNSERSGGGREDGENDVLLAKNRNVEADTDVTTGEHDGEADGRLKGSPAPDYGIGEVNKRAERPKVERFVTAAETL